MNSSPTSSPSILARLRLSGSGGAALRVRFIGVLAFQLLLVIIFTTLAPRFLSWDNAQSILFTAAILAMAAAGQTLVVLTGNLDLSVGSIMGLVAYVVFDVSSNAHWLMAFTVPIAIALGGVLGLFNGVLVAYLKIPSMVATLGTLSVYRGLVSFYANAMEVTSGELPRWMRDLATARWLGLSSYVWIALLVVIIVGLALSRLPWGRKLYAYG